MCDEWESVGDIAARVVDDLAMRPGTAPALIRRRSPGYVSGLSVDVGVGFVGCTTAHCQPGRSPELEKGVGFAGFGRSDEDRAQRPPKASPRVMTLSADMDPGGVCAGPGLKDEAATADGTERIAGRSPPFGAAGRHRRGRMEREKGRAPTGGEAPGQGEGGICEVVWKRPPLTGFATGRSWRDTHPGRPPAGFRAHARN